VPAAAHGQQTREIGQWHHDEGQQRDEIAKADNDLVGRWSAWPKRTPRQPDGGCRGIGLARAWPGRQHARTATQQRPQPPGAGQRKAKAAQHRLDTRADQWP
jgi:hypothetical protein